MGACNIEHTPQQTIYVGVFVNGWEEQLICYYFAAVIFFKSGCNFLQDFVLPKNTRNNKIN